jgi:tetratricopeptide (TPR) repeat protein/transglutaminase-like putative cysteine protease
MNRRWVALLGLLCLAAAAYAQENSDSAPAPTRAAPAAQSANTPEAAYPQEPFVIEQFYTTARFEDDGTSDRDVAVRIRVQSDAGVQQLGELVFGFSSANEQMDVRYVRVRKPDGTVVTADADAIKEMTAPVARDAPVYTDYKEKHITVPALAPGAILEYDIDTRLVTPLAPGEFWFQHNFITTAIALDERLTIDVPQRHKINLESAADTPYETTTKNGRTIYTWKHTNLTRPSEDDDSTKKKAAQKPEDKKPDVQLTTFTGWGDVARWYAKLEQTRTEPTPEVRAKTQELIQGRATDLDKIEALYDYVAKNIRYVSLSFGLGRYQPHAASEIFQNQYGDCKDKHTLLASMLQAAGFPSDAVLISYTHKLDPTMPSPSQFDHVITAVPRGNDLIWIDSTAEVAPFRLLASPLRKKSALLIPPDGAGKIVETPADPPFVSSQRVAIEGQVSDLGKLTAQAHYTLRGDTELLLRLAFRRTPQTQWKQLGQTILTLDGLHGEVTDVKPSEPTATQNPFELDIGFTQSNFLDWSSKKAKAAMPLLAISLPDPPQDDTQPIELGSPLNVDVQLKLDLPPAFTAQAPIAVSVSRDYAEFKSSYHFTGHTLAAERSLDFKIRELPADRSSDYAAFARAVNADESQALVVENPTPGSPEIPSSAKADELFEAGLAALNSGNTRAAIPLFQRVVALDPQHKQAWNDLGLAYLRDGKDDEAAAAFQKQLGVNPFDEHANDYLGLALEEQQKLPEAIGAFRKQIEVNPLDLMAHAALGAIFLQQHEYPEAVPELEKATILAPDNAELQVSLGRAYLNTGEKDKALAAFDKGSGLSQAPIIWNDIAYDLADNRIELDRAQQYAESAVSAVAANLRNIDLKSVTLEQVAQVNSIGAYWDTLGWVYFQRGDIQKASRYITAGWLLDEHGEVGDHLAQIYDKLGDKDRAIHTYALALAAPHSVPDTRARLTLLLKGNAGIDDLVSKARPELLSERSFAVKATSKQDATADFLILLSPAGTDGNSTKVEGVKFVSGSDALQSYADRLAALDYHTVFPDASPVKIVRRGTLSCSVKTGDCTFTLLLPEDVHAVN